MSGDLNRIFSSTVLKTIVLIILTAVLIACGNRHSNLTTGQKPGKDEMADINKFLVQKDGERIRNYIERKGLENMIESSTGLWYKIIKGGSGRTFMDNDRIVMNYECSLLDGTKCYSSEELGPKEIILGKTNIETGLNEGLRLLRPGAEAIFIIPPYLAYGLIGDRKMIPSRAVIVYNVNILQP